MLKRKRRSREKYFLSYPTDCEMDVKKQLLNNPQLLLFWRESRQVLPCREEYEKIICFSVSYGLQNTASLCPS